MGLGATDPEEWDLQGPSDLTGTWLCQHESCLVRRPVLPARQSWARDKGPREPRQRGRSTAKAAVSSRDPSPAHPAGLGCGASAPSGATSCRVESCNLWALVPPHHARNSQPAPGEGTPPLCCLALGVSNRRCSGRWHHLIGGRGPREAGPVEDEQEGRACTHLHMRTCEQVGWGRRLERGGQEASLTCAYRIHIHSRGSL